MNHLTPEKITRNELIRSIKARTNMRNCKLAEDFKLSEPRISVILRDTKKKYDGSLRYTKKTIKPKFLKEINDFRKESGLPKLKYKKRKCLKCDDKFDSQGDHNRLCWRCRRSNKDESIDYDIDL